MQRAKLKVQKVVGILTDPHPEFVSLVNFPANQTPFTSIKFDKTQAQGETAAALAQRAASAVVSIVSVSFAKSQFKSEDAVTAYMEENGYTDYAIEDRGDHYFIPGEPADEPDIETTGEIEVAKGVIMSVARHRSVRKSAATEVVQTPEELLAAEKAAPVRTHKSLYSVSEMAYVLMSAAYILSDMKYEAEYDGDDGDSAAVGKFKSWLSDGARLFESMATEEVSDLVEWASKAQVTKEAFMAVKSVDTKTTPVAASATAPTAVKPAATATVEDPEPKEPVEPVEPTPAEPTPSEPTPNEPVPEEPAPADKAAATTGKVDETPAAPQEPVAKGAEPPAVDLSVLADMIGKAVKDGIAPLSDKAEAVEAKLTELTASVAKTDERVSEIETRRQARRSRDADDLPQPVNDAERAKRDAAWSRRQARDHFGI